MREKLTDETIEKIRAMLATGAAKNAVARKLGLSWSTVDKYSKTDADSLEDLREQKKQEFIKKAWEDIESAMFLGRQKIKLATVTIEKFEETIEELITLLQENPETNGKDIVELVKAISSVTSIPLAHISTYFGTLYDKQALANGEPTSRNEGETNVRHTHTVDLASLSDEELAILEKIIKSSHSSD